GNDMVRKAPLTDEAAGVASIDDLDGAGQRNACPFRRSAPFGGREENRVANHVVHELHRVPGARSAEVEYAGGDPIKYGTRAEQRRLVPTHHQRERASSCTSRATRHASIKIGRTRLSSPRGKCAGGLRVGGGEVYENAIRRSGEEPG